jgi:hypothetical protein
VSGGGYDDEGADDGDLDLDLNNDLGGGRPRRIKSSLGSLPKPALAGLVLVVVLLLGFAVFAVFGGLFGGDGEEGITAPPPRPAGRYDDQVRQVFLDECNRVSKGATAYCTCTLEKLEAAYSQGEYLEFSDNVGDAKSQRIIREISESCRAAG